MVYVHHTQMEMGNDIILHCLVRPHSKSSIKIRRWLILAWGSSPPSMPRVTSWKEFNSFLASEEGGVVMVDESYGSWVGDFRTNPYRWIGLPLLVPAAHDDGTEDTDARLVTIHERIVEVYLANEHLVNEVGHTQT